nr:PREDICTED: glutathione peroxidase 1-like [Equus przewalskii]
MGVIGCEFLQQVPLNYSEPYSAQLPVQPAWESKNEEILNCLKYVRPGGGFKPNFTLFEFKVNGALHTALRLPAGGSARAGDDAAALMTDPKFITWSPVCRINIIGNFEKFLVGPDRVPVRRYSRHCLTFDMEPDVEVLLSQGPSCA